MVSQLLKIAESKLVAYSRLLEITKSAKRKSVAENYWMQVSNTENGCIVLLFSNLLKLVIDLLKTVCLSNSDVENLSSVQLTFIYQSFVFPRNFKQTSFYLKTSTNFYCMNLPWFFFIAWGPLIYVKIRTTTPSREQNDEKCSQNARD